MIGPHILNGTEAAKAWARTAGICKQVDNTDCLALAPDDAIRVFRAHVPDHEQDSISPEGFVDRALTRLNGYRHPRLYVELLNEHHTPIEWVRTAVGYLAGEGLQVAGPGSWGTGDYQQDEWERFRANDWCGLSLISLHCYWAGAGFTPYNALRYRSFWRPGDPPIAVTECGRDRVRDGDSRVNNGWIGNGGWKADGVSPEQYRDELRAYAIEISRDRYVLGATVFSCGVNDRWRDYDVDELVPSLINLTAQSGTGVGMSPIDVGPGLARVEPLIGPFDVSEDWKWPGTDRETSIIATARGVGIWRRSTNEVLVYVDENQSIWRDWGNRGTGVLKKVHAL